MVVTVTLAGAEFAIAHGVAILVPITGLDTLPAPADIGWYLDASSGLVAMDWTQVEGAAGYKVIRSDYFRSNWSPYNGIPRSYEWGDWSWDQFLPPGDDPETPLYTEPGTPIDRVWKDVGHSWEEDPRAPFIFVSAVGEPQEKLNGKPLPGRLSRTVAVNSDDIIPVLGEDGDFRVVGPVVVGKPTSEDRHGVNDTPAAGIRRLKGQSFGPEPGSVTVDEIPVEWDRVVSWTSEAVKFVVGPELVDEAIARISDWNGVHYPTPHNVIATVPRFGEPSQAWFEPGTPFVIPVVEPGVDPLEASFWCDGKVMGSGDASSMIEKNADGDLVVTLDYEEGEQPCYQCRCELAIKVAAADGKEMYDPYWRWPLTPLVKDLNTKIAVAPYPDGAVWFGGMFGTDFFQPGMEGRLGPSPTLMWDVERLAWDFGDKGRDVLTATDMAAIMAVLDNGGDVALFGQLFLAHLADGDADHFAWKVLGVKSSRAVRLTDRLIVPADSPAHDLFPDGIELLEECWHNVAYLPETVEDCTVVMTTETVKAERAAVIVCNGNLLISGVRFACFEEEAVAAFDAALDWE